MDSFPENASRLVTPYFKRSHTHTRAPAIIGNHACRDVTHPVCPMSRPHVCGFCRNAEPLSAIPAAARCAHDCSGAAVTLGRPEAREYEPCTCSDIESDEAGQVIASGNRTRRRGSPTRTCDSSASCARSTASASASSRRSSRPAGRPSPISAGTALAPSDSRWTISARHAGMTPATWSGSLTRAPCSTIARSHTCVDCAGEASATVSSPSVSPAARAPHATSVRARRGLTDPHRAANAPTARRAGIGLVDTPRGCQGTSARPASLGALTPGCFSSGLDFSLTDQADDLRSDRLTDHRHGDLTSAHRALADVSTGELAPSVPLQRGAASTPACTATGRSVADRASAIIFPAGSVSTQRSAVTLRERARRQVARTTARTRRPASAAPENSRAAPATRQAARACARADRGGLIAAGTIASFARVAPALMQGSSIAPSAATSSLDQVDTNTAPPAARQSAESSLPPANAETGRRIHDQACGVWPLSRTCLRTAHCRVPYGRRARRETRTWCA